MIDIVAAVNGSLDVMEISLILSGVDRRQAGIATTALTGCIDKNLTDAMVCYRATMPPGTPDRYRVMFSEIWFAVAEQKGEWVKAHPDAKVVPSYRDLSR